MSRIGYQHFLSRKQRIQRRVTFHQTAVLQRRIKTANRLEARKRPRERALQLRLENIADSLSKFIQDARKVWPGAILAAFDGELSLIWGLDQDMPLELFQAPVSTLQGGEGVTKTEAVPKGAEPEGRGVDTGFPKEYNHADQDTNPVEMRPLPPGDHDGWRGNSCGMETDSEEPGDGV